MLRNWHYLFRFRIFVSVWWGPIVGAEGWGVPRVRANCELYLTFQVLNTVRARLQGKQSKEVGGRLLTERKAHT